MQDNCRNCLAQEVCDITGGVCQKMDALFAQRKSVTNGRTTMTNSKNSATPKDVAAKATEVKDAETTVPAQAAAPAEPKTDSKTEPKDVTANAAEGESLSLIQRLKSTAQKLGKNRKAMLLLGASAVVAGLAIKNSRKAVSAEPLDVEDTTIEGVGDPDETTDSL